MSYIILFYGNKKVFIYYNALESSDLSCVLPAKIWDTLFLESAVLSNLYTRKDRL